MRLLPLPSSRLSMNRAPAVAVPKKLLQAMSANFQKLQALYRARRDKVDSWMVVVDKAEADVQELVAQMQVWFAEAQQDQKATQDQLGERQRELLLKQADIEKAQEVAKA
mgnify:CR=1 FL=1